MKRKFFVLAGIIAFISAAVFAKEDVMKVDTNLFSLSIPEGWGAMNSSEIVRGRKLLCLMAPIGEDENFQSNLNITMEQMPVKCSEKEFLENGANDLAILFPNFKILETGKNYHVYIATVNGNNLKQVQFIKIKDKAVYVLTGTSTLDDFDSHYDEFKNIFKTFKLKNSAKSSLDDIVELTVKDCSVKLPAEWFLQYENSAHVFNIYSPVNKKSGLRSSGYLIKETLDKEYSAKEYLGLLETYYPMAIENFHIISSDENSHVYTATNGDSVNIKEKQFVQTADKKTFYLFTFTALEDEYDTYEDSFSTIVESLRVQ